MKHNIAYTVRFYVRISGVGEDDILELVLTKNPTVEELQELINAEPTLSNFLPWGLFYEIKPVNYFIVQEEKKEEEKPSQEYEKYEKTGLDPRD